MNRLVQVMPSENQIRWQSMEFTGFLHYGINTFTNKEWGDGKEDISIFNPQRLDTDQWCESMVKARMKGCIITAKHHDGFCLFDTKHTEHNVMNTPFGKDIVRLLSDSCSRHGLKLGAYLSPWDRNSKLYGQGKPYDDYFCNQLAELLTNYGPLYTVWFDGACGEGPNGKKQRYDWKRYYEVIRRLQPEAVISICGPDVRWCGNEAGDCRESEWSVVPARLAEYEYVASASQKRDDGEFRNKKLSFSDKDLGSREAVADEKDLIWYPAEVDTSIRPGWFHHESEDGEIKSFDKLKEIYLNSVGGNAVLLLNIPPRRDGYFTAGDVRRLEEIGNFIKDTFAVNLAEKCRISASSNPDAAGGVLSPGDEYWQPAKYDSDCEIRVDFDAPRQIGYITLQEQIRFSQRVEAFEVSALTEDGSRKSLYKGTTIGYKKICVFEPVTVGTLIIKFHEYRESPALKFLGIYK